MTKEQEEAIGYLKESVLIYKNTIPKISESIETVLNMLKEKDAEIEKLEQTLAGNIARNVTSSMKESAKSKEDLEMLNAGWQIELEKKDKQIKFMANFINDNTPYTKDTKELENEEGIRTLDFTVKYFERKSKK